MMGNSNWPPGAGPTWRGRGRRHDAPHLFVRLGETMTNELLRETTGDPQISIPLSEAESPGDSETKLKLRSDSD